MSNAVIGGSVGVRQDDLDRAVTAGVIDGEGAVRLWQFLTARPAPPPGRFDLTNIFWYAGALIVIAAMGLFSSEAFGRWGGGALAVTAVIYAIAFGLAGAFFWRSSGLKTLGGLLVTVAVSMAPLAVFGLQREFGWTVSPNDPVGAYRDFFVWIRASWVPLDLAAIVAGSIAVYFFRFSLITAAIAMGAWFLTMDLAQFLMVQLSTEPLNYRSYEVAQVVRGYVSLGIGAVLVVAAWWLDLHNNRSLTFWLHFAAGLCLITGMGFLLLRSNETELDWALYCGACVVMLLFAVYIRRWSYLVFGALGIASYLGHLAWEVFKDSLEFTFALTAVGISIIVLGYLWMRVQEPLNRWMETAMPSSLRRLRPL